MTGSAAGEGMAKLSVPGLTLLRLAAFCLRVEAAIEEWYYIMPSLCTWEGARDYCAQRHVDLAPLATMSHSQLSEWMLRISVAQIWVGLHRDPDDETAWKWINTRTGVGMTGSNLVSSSYWAAGEPLTPDCGLFNAATSEWMTDSCTVERNVMCIGDNLRVVKEEKTWEEALRHCRDLEVDCATEPCSDLLTLTEDQEHDYVRDRITRAQTTDEVWIGLRFAAGEWWGADGQSLNHKMSPDCLSPQTHCGIVSRNEASGWLTRDCAERKHFVCIVVVG